MVIATLAAFADNMPMGDPSLELITKDHYILRLLYSQGIPLERLGVRPMGQPPGEVDGRDVWRVLADNYHLFRGTPSKLWLDHTMAEVFGIGESLNADTSDRIYDEISTQLRKAEFSPRALFERFGLEFLATTDGAIDPLAAHAHIQDSGWAGRVVPTFRPDDVVDPDRPDFTSNLGTLADMTGEDTLSWSGYLQAIRNRRAAFKRSGATATDHGHPTALTADLSHSDAEDLFSRVVSGRAGPGDAELFRGMMLFQMAGMSLDDGLVMQIHAGSWRGHNPMIASRFGPDMGADIPRPTDYVGALHPLLGRFGNESGLTLVIYTLDETTYSRELAPLAGHYPALRLGPPWWFYDSPEGMLRFYRHVIETAGFSNTVGFNDDARSLLTIPARHDVARRVNARYLAGLVADHRLSMGEAAEVAVDLAYSLASRAFRVAP